MFKARKDEPGYARLRSDQAVERNVHGNPVDLIASSSVPVDSSLYINGDSSVGTTENRNKQHGFHFTADNCIGCHACEAACSEKNDLPPHLSFRSVGYIEGGSYPNLTRMNLSMACNHCDDPVCLKGCPTNAYTKHSEYGAVLQDPDTCFGCGYCTWVCPYNAPQLDPVEGQVQKCNMCVDRLEVGLKPACVSACVGNALDFGVIESTSENRHEAKVSIPGFPNPEISKPNIRFQQTKSLPDEFRRPDSQDIKYCKEGTSNSYVPTVDLKHSIERKWSLAELNSRENPLVIFTLFTQAVVGAFSILFVGSAAGIDSFQTVTTSSIVTAFLLILTGLQAFVLFLSTQHLGKPWRFYRGFNNLRHSPLSKEALAISIFFSFLPLIMLSSLFQSGFLSLYAGTSLQVQFLSWEGDKLLAYLTPLFVSAAVISGIVGLYYMHCIYRIKARPFWNHWQVLSSFFGTMFSLGAILIGLFCLPLAWLSGIELSDLVKELSAFVSFGLLLEGVGHFFHARDLQRKGQEGNASFQVLKSKFGKTYIARNISLTFCILAISLLPLLLEGTLLLGAFYLTSLIVLCTALVSRALFYVLVIPTTMPGAFFWKIKGFENHARETGLAKLPQVGVVEFDH